MKLKKPKWIFLNKKTIINEKLLEPTVIGLKSKPTIITIKSVFLSFVLMSLISFPVLAESFCPSRLIDKKGSSSQQPLESLCDEDWSEFIEFMPDERGYKGIIVFRLKNIDTALLEDMSVHANFRGPDSDHQKWFFYLLDVDSGKWIKIMDNAQVSSWNWGMITKTISAEPTRFIDSRQRVKLRYSTLSSLDNSQLDYLALDLSLSDQASLPPSSESPLPPSSEPPVNPGAWWQPAPGNRWQVQYTGAVDTSLDVDVYNLDLFDTPKSVIDNLHSQGKKVICYFSAGSFEDWRPDAQQFPSEVKGQNLDGWPGEKWLDIRRLDILLPIMEARMDMAVQKNWAWFKPR